MELIDKDKVVAEIEERIASLEYIGSDDYLHDYFPKQFAMMTTLKSLKLSINTFEVKEVDLDESARHYLLHEHTSPLNEILHKADLKVEMQYHKDIEDAYKAGFELGLKAQKGE